MYLTYTIKYPFVKTFHYPPSQQDKLPLADTNGINRFKLCSPAPKLRKPYGWAGISTSTRLCR